MVGRGARASRRPQPEELTASDRPRPSRVVRPLLQDHALQRGTAALHHGTCLARTLGPIECVHWGGPAMMTIVTTVRLKEGAQQEWDTVMRERLAAARKQAGWVGGQLLRPENQNDTRIIVG